MIRFTTGDILSADAEGVVNAVNCVGVMGRGLALQFKHASPATLTPTRRRASAARFGRVRCVRPWPLCGSPVHPQLSDEATLA